MKKNKNNSVAKTGMNILKQISGKSSENIKNIKENSYAKKLEKRAEIEQYTLAKLPRGQALKYKSILDTIDHQFEIVENENSSLREKAAARGKIKALRKARNEIEMQFAKKPRFAKRDNKSKDNKTNNSSVESNNMLGELGKLFEPHNENHRR